MSNFITATQEWVKNRMEEVRGYADIVKESLKGLINSLSDRENQHYGEMCEQFASLSDSIRTGSISVDGDAAITGGADVTGSISCESISTKGPIISNDPAGLVINTPKGIAGINPNGFSLMNEKGKLTRFFMRGDSLYCDYRYDMIYTCYDSEIGCSLQFLHRGGTKLRSIVDQIEANDSDQVRYTILRQWFSNPKAFELHRPARLFKSDCNECFPSLGTQYMIPESIYFRCPDMYKVDSVRMLDKDGQTIKILKDLKDYDIKELLVNFPYVRSVSEAELPPDVQPQPEVVFVPDPNKISVTHIADFEHGYYEVTDPEAIFHESLDTGLIPNVILNLWEFPKDTISIIYFKVVRAR